MGEFIKSCFDHEAVVVKEIRGRKASQEERLRRAIQASYVEMGYGLVCSSCYCNAVWGTIVLMGMF